MVIRGMKLSKTYPVYVTTEGAKYMKKKVKAYKPKKKEAGASTIRISVRYQ